MESNRQPPVGQERNRLAQLGAFICKDNRIKPWTREMVAQALALAQLGRGPYAAKWGEMRGERDWRPS